MHTDRNFEAFYVLMGGFIVDFVYEKGKGEVRRESLYI